MITFKLEKRSSKSTEFARSRHSHSLTLPVDWVLKRRLTMNMKSKYEIKRLSQHEWGGAVSIRNINRLSRAP